MYVIRPDGAGPTHRTGAARPHRGGRTSGSERVAARHSGADVASRTDDAERFFDYWAREVAPTYTFALEVDGRDERRAVGAITELLERRGSPPVDTGGP